ncbi:MAG: toll/interleukin-1 receptor domain-containing protein [Desulfovibrionales bacterium]|nr:toll/interleukin-1 receptor domain-containing protein [Desulfovibrionales bacterium]
MANEEHVNIVLQGAKAIAFWRERYPNIRLDLRGANLRRADFVRANLNGAMLMDANLEWADLRWTDLIGADLSGAQLTRADFHKADLSTARFPHANLSDANFEDANCQGAEFDSTVFSHTRLLNTDLRGAKGLSATKHHGPSFIDRETLTKSGHMPREFMRGCGLNESAIQAVYANDQEALAINLGSEGDYYSCFISYSSRDESFAEKLYLDLQKRGVRCWYAPHDMKIGDRILDSIYAAIRQREKLLLILSKKSVTSEWVRDEVERAFAEERDRGDTVVFPVQIDEEVLNSDMPWARKIRENRHIGDFSQWGIENEYQRSLQRLLRDLKR